MTRPSTPPVAILLAGGLGTRFDAAGRRNKLLAPLPIDIKINGQGAGIAIRKGDTELKDKLNAAIKAIRANGKYKEINEKYFKFDVYGG